MKKGRFTEHQIISALKKHEAGLSIKDISRELGISEATFYNWKAKNWGKIITQNTLIKPLVTYLHKSIPNSILKIINPKKQSKTKNT